MGDAQGSRGVWINNRERDRKVADPSRERVSGWNCLGCIGSMASLARWALSLRCVAGTMFMMGFVAMFVWG